MIHNALDLTAEDTEAISADRYPQWAREALAALNGNGFRLDGEKYLTRADAAQALYTASLLLDEAPGMQILRMQ